jgi:hypothetical protein
MNKYDGCQINWVEEREQDKDKEGIKGWKKKMIFPVIFD